MALPRNSELVFPGITERRLLKRLKEICYQIGLSNSEKYKLHSFRHHFASLCANHRVAHRKALAWLGHSSSEILGLYYHLHDADSQAAMKSLADDTFSGTELIAKIDDLSESTEGGFEGNLRANGQSTIEKKPQAPEVQELVAALCGQTERAGFEPAVRFWRTHPFQGCTFGHSDTSPEQAVMIADILGKVNDWLYAEKTTSPARIVCLTFRISPISFSNRNTEASLPASRLPRCSRPI